MSDLDLEARRAALFARYVNYEADFCGLLGALGRAVAAVCDDEGIEAWVGDAEDMSALMEQRQVALFDDTVTFLQASACPLS